MDRTALQSTAQLSVLRAQTQRRPLLVQKGLRGFLQLGQERAGLGEPRRPDERELLVSVFGLFRAEMALGLGRRRSEAADVVGTRMWLVERPP